MFTDIKTYTYTDICRYIHIYIYVIRCLHVSSWCHPRGFSKLLLHHPGIILVSSVPVVFPLHIRCCQRWPSSWYHPGAPGLKVAKSSKTRSFLEKGPGGDFDLLIILAYRMNHPMLTSKPVLKPYNTLKQF